MVSTYWFVAYTLVLMVNYNRSNLNYAIKISFQDILQKSFRRVSDMDRNQLKQIIKKVLKIHNYLTFLKEGAFKKYFCVVFLISNF